jgi:carbonic anhydrase
MDTKYESQKKFETQLKEWGTLINLLAVKMENPGSEMNQKYAQELNTIRGNQREAVEKIKELKGARGEAWERVKVTVDKAWYKLGTGIAQAVRNIK